MRGDDKGHWETRTGEFLRLGRENVWLFSEYEHVFVYLDALTLEEKFASQDEILGTLSEAPTSPQHLDREGVREEAA